jgi:hypothetical protein
MSIHRITRPYANEIAAGDVDGEGPFLMFGYNQDVDVVTSPETIWMGGGSLYPWPAAAAVIAVSCINAIDLGAIRVGPRFTDVGTNFTVLNDPLGNFVVAGVVPGDIVVLPDEEAHAYVLAVVGPTQLTLRVPTPLRAHKSFAPNRGYYIYNPTGPGAAVVRLDGLDVAGEEIAEYVLLNGIIGAVNTIQSFWRVNKMQVVLTGTNGQNAGDIIARHGASVVRQIPAGAVIDAGCIYTVPKNQELYITEFGTQEATANGVQVALFKRENMILDSAPYPLTPWLGPGAEQTVFNCADMPIVIRETQDLELRARAAADNTDVYAWMRGFFGQYIPPSV